MSRASAVQSVNCGVLPSNSTTVMCSFEGDRIVGGVLWRVGGVFTVNE